MIKKINRNEIRLRKHVRVRKKISGTPERPRLCVFRSLANISAQLIDDVNGKTLAAASSTEKAIKAENAYGGNVAAAKAVGALVAKRALELNLDTVVFDRSGYVYHGRVAALAQAAREAGLKF